VEKGHQEQIFNSRQRLLVGYASENGTIFYVPQHILHSSLELTGTTCWLCCPMQNVEESIGKALYKAKVTFPYFGQGSIAFLIA